MASASLEAASFVVGACAACATQVLTHVDFDADGMPLRRCLQCDAVVDAGLARVGAEVLETHGYALLDARTCGNGGGCASGGCGMRQHD